MDSGQTDDRDVPVDSGKARMDGVKERVDGEAGGQVGTATASGSPPANRRWFDAVVCLLLVATAFAVGNYWRPLESNTEEEVEVAVAEEENEEGMRHLIKRETDEAGVTTSFVDFGQMTTQRIRVAFRREAQDASLVSGRLLPPQAVLGDPIKRVQVMQSSECETVLMTADSIVHSTSLEMYTSHHLSYNEIGRLWTFDVPVEFVARAGSASDASIEICGRRTELDEEHRRSLRALLRNPAPFIEEAM